MHQSLTAATELDCEANILAGLKADEALLRRVPLRVEKRGHFKGHKVKYSARAIDRAECAAWRVLHQDAPKSSLPARAHGVVVCSLHGTLLSRQLVFVTHSSWSNIKAENVMGWSLNTLEDIDDAVVATEDVGMCDAYELIGPAPCEICAR